MKGTWEKVVDDVHHIVDGGGDAEWIGGVVKVESHFDRAAVEGAHHRVEGNY